MGELKRRLVHFAGTGYPALYLVDRAVGPILGWGGLQAILVWSAAVALALEALRLTGRIDWRIFDRLTREYEQNHLAGYALYLFGMAGAALLFRPVVAVPAMLMLAIGDPVSGLLSSGQLGKRPVVLGAMFGVCLGVALPFVLFETLPVVAALLGAATATAADGLKPVIRGYVIDDNVTIPLGAGAMMAAVIAISG